MTIAENILSVNRLCKSFDIESSFVAALKKRIQGRRPDSLKALDNVSFSLKKGETLGILGESGSGKSTLARILMGIYQPESGSASLLGEEIVRATGRARLNILKNMQMVFQDPFGSLDPRMTIRQIISEPLKIHGIKQDGPIDEFLARCLNEVGLDAGALVRYPSEFSGGQRQRIGICRSLILNPQLIIADEAVSALDVSVQAQILELMVRLRRDRQLSMIFISHDVAVVRQISDRILLLYRGNLVEELPADSLIEGARHPYTRKLLDAALFLREGRIAANVSEKKETFTNGGCCYQNDCSFADEQCRKIPELLEIAPGHKLACWRSI